MIKYYIFLFLGFVLIISCASKDEKLQNYKDYIQKISNEIKFEDGFNTIKVIGERRSIFRSYFLKDELVFITEDVSIGNRGSSVNQYYFKDNNLISYNEKTIILKDNSLNITSKKTTVVENDVEKIINHAALLKELAEKNRPKSKL
ncbi:MAG: hypothetical protein MUF28_13285 [Ignavibacterium sp.]|nr:hypothetical protein [Ignavibacterium sp.]